jgi:hypothetical protein
MNIICHREGDCACIICVDNWTKIRVVSMLVHTLVDIMGSKREFISAAKAQVTLLKIKEIK